MVAFFQQVGGADDRMFFAPERSATRADKEKLATTPTVGVKVMAPWTNGKLYPGKVSRVGMAPLTILFGRATRARASRTACTAGATGTVSIHEAIRRKDLRAVKKCIESGRDANVKSPDGNYPLANAAHDGLTEIVDTLLLNGAEVNKQAATGRARRCTMPRSRATRPASAGSSTPVPTSTSGLERAAPDAPRKRHIPQAHRWSC